MPEYFDVVSLDTLKSHKSSLIRQQLEAQETSQEREAFLFELLGLADFASASDEFFLANY